MMKWAFKETIVFDKTDYKDEMPKYGFHDHLGGNYICSYFGHYVGCIVDGQVTWTAGEHDPGLSDVHYSIALDTPKYICRMHHQNALLISEKRYVYKLDLATMSFQQLIDCDKAAILDSGCSVCDFDDDIWINDIQGGAVFRFSSEGEFLERIGQKSVGFNEGTVPFEQAAFDWIYDIRLGPEGHLYVLDSKNYSLRKIDIGARNVTTICGDGTPGESPHECPLSEARFGSSPGQHFDGPWSLFVDEDSNIIIGDTWNHTVRLIERGSNVVRTIAPVGDEVHFHRICGMDYHNGIVYIPDWPEDGYTLTLLEKQDETAAG